METIIILALVFFFVGLRLYSVLGRRTGHEQPIAKPVEPQVKPAGAPRAVSEVSLAKAPASDVAVEPRARDGVKAIAAADQQFDPATFLEGAKAAYRMILEAFWSGDEEAIAPLVEADVREAFAGAIAERRAAGHVLDNRLISIERAMIDAARLEGRTAIVTVRFDADVAAVTRDADGTIVDGKLDDAVPTHDAWTFSRNVQARDPNWILIETDEAA